MQDKGSKRRENKKIKLFDFYTQSCRYAIQQKKELYPTKQRIQFQPL